MMIRSSFISIIAAGILIFSGCSAARLPIPTEQAQTYRPVRLATAVPARPGALAWSRDGSSLAWVERGVAVYDRRTAQKKTIPVADPHFISWMSDVDLLVLAHLDAGERLYHFNIATGATTSAAMPDHSIAAYPAAGNTVLAIVAASAIDRSIGTELDVRVLSRHLSTNSTMTVYHDNRIVPIRGWSLGSLVAWTHAGLNPVDDSLLLFEIVKPPMFPVYTRVISLDLWSNEKTEHSDPDPNHRGVFTSAAWSPDGTNIALSSADHGPVVLTREKRGRPLDRTSIAQYPSWSPDGERIYAGGAVLEADGSSTMHAIRNGADGLGLWSPDGSCLAVADDSLWLLCGFPVHQPERLDPRKKSIRLLQELFRDNLIDPDEYSERRHAIMTRTETKP